MSEALTEGTLFVQTTLKILGGKWKILILWHLKEETRRFSELKRLIPEITEKMLSQQLRELANDGIISRKAYSELPPKVEYSFTAYGKTLVPVLQALCNWGEEHLERLKAEIEEDS
ncbi:winged helix-turn-helix transcriptional regulator [Pseudanabaena sp. FACHB-2040]|uniref:winged helix-turn-helix transcriptional regulator n=1 Tax=Pseudanabaena sp. FACHB-2040 TaxID=2692859 RepID=UPI001686E3FB|nr:winged helix-turn-helix transcriptional regulator [Pseudanabaena sp. FACHB-2040]MBD2255989.1 winged helix-turn-helix transcriptional regulator [Pseudanabaena sp. FACHB-2040]